MFVERGGACMKKLKVSIIFIITLTFVCGLFVACQNKSKQVRFSDLVDWNKEKIAESGYPEWAPALVQNKTYVFYQNADWEIIQVDKNKHKKTIIKKLTKLRDSSYDVGLALSNNRLYYIYDSCLYQCDFNGDNETQIVSKQKLKQFTKNKNIQETVDGVKFYKNDMYLIIGGDVLIKFNFDTKELQTVAKEVESGAFYKDNFYYVNATAIYKVNLKTFKRSLVRGQKWSKKFLKSNDTVYYQQVMRIKGKLYYACYQGKWVSEGAAPSKLYLYNENGKDVKKYNASVTLFHSVNDGSKIAYYDVHPTETKLILVIYDLDTGKERKIDLPKDFSQVEQLVDDILLYRTDKGQPTYSVFKIR